MVVLEWAWADKDSEVGAHTSGPQDLLWRLVGTNPSLETSEYP